MIGFEAQARLGFDPFARFNQIDGVEVLEFDAGVGGCEAPICLGVIFISVMLPGGDLVSEDLLIGDAAVETLGRQDAEFRLRQIEPAAVLWRVMPFEPLDQPRASAAGKAS